MCVVHWFAKPCQGLTNLSGVACWLHAGPQYYILLIGRSSCSLLRPCIVHATVFGCILHNLATATKNKKRKTNKTPLDIFLTRGGARLLVFFGGKQSSSLRRFVVAWVGHPLLGKEQQRHECANQFYQSFLIAILAPALQCVVPAIAYAPVSPLLVQLS